MKFWLRHRLVGSTSPWIVFTALIYGVVFAYFFWQNFIFSSNLEMLAFRADDDAFQYILRLAHDNATFIGLNDYAYGWIFWFPLVLLTYPFYLLSIYFDVHTPLIVFPRQVALIFTFATAIVLNKIVLVYSKDSILRAAILLLFISFPINAHFSLRFSPTTQTMFFSCLAFYFTVRNYEVRSRDIRLVALTLAIAVGTKLSAMLIVPVIGMLLGDRLHWSINKDTLRKTAEFVTIFFAGSLLLAQMSVEKVLFQINKTATQYNPQGDLFQTASSALPGFTVSHWVFALLIAGLTLQAAITLRRKRHFRDFIFMVLGLAIAMLYLTMRIRQGPSYIANYFTTISFLLLLGVTVIEPLPRNLKLLICAVLVVGNIFMNRDILWIKDKAGHNWMAFNFYYVYQHSSHLNNLTNSRDAIESMVPTLSEYPNGIRILRGHRAPIIFSRLRQGVEESVIYDNVGVFSSSPLIPYDLIILSRQSRAFDSEKEFWEFTKDLSPDIRYSYEKDRELIQRLINDGTIHNTKYKTIYDEEGIVAFLRP